MKDETLLPCPFCGGVPEEDAYGCIEYGGHEHQDYTITCKSCGAEVSCINGVHDGADVECSCHHDTRKICVDKWNKRTANSPAIPAGWKLVPVEQTPEMRKKIHPMTESDCPDCGKRVAADCYENMIMSWDDLLSTVPQPPVSASGWIKCSDRMPEDDSYVVAAEIGHDGTIYAAVASWFLHNRFNLMEDGISASNYDGGACIDMNLSVTHWMPLPAAPKPEGE